LIFPSGQFLTTWHCILSAELTKKDCFLVILPTGFVHFTHEKGKIMEY